MSRRRLSLLPVAESHYQPKVIDCVQAKLAKRKQRNTQAYDKHARPLPKLMVGQPVRQRCHSSFIQRNSYIFNTCLNKKNHHRSIHNIRLQMIIDNQVFEFSNTCTVGASIRVVTV